MVPSRFFLPNESPTMPIYWDNDSERFRDENTGRFVSNSEGLDSDAYWEYVEAGHELPEEYRVPVIGEIEEFYLEEGHLDFDLFEDYDFEDLEGLDDDPVGS